MSLVLRVSDLWKGYDGNAVLKGCSFSFDRGGIYVVMGRNGCGKSTFLRLCCLLEEPEKGEVNYFSGPELLGKDMGVKRRITLVLPSVGVFNTTVFNNIAYGLKIRGMKRRAIEEKVNGYLEFFGLIHRRNQNARTLSSGEAQRLGIARAMVTDPDILFLDEPTASVDQKNSEIIEEIILGMRKKGLPTVVMTTHDISQAERLSDFLLVINDGKISAKNVARD